jgi:hypothetical protein
MEFRAIQLATKLGGVGDTDEDTARDCSCPDDETGRCSCGGDEGGGDQGTGGECSCGGDEGDEGDQGTGGDCSCGGDEQGGGKSGVRTAQPGLIALQRELREKLGQEMKAGS